MALNKKQLKTLQTLERRVELCREFMNDWLLFNQILSAYPKADSNKAQLESQFLKIKSKLAREHRVLKDTLQADYGIDGNLMNIVSGATSLENIYAQSEVSIKKLQTEWHRAFISINETLGLLDDKRTRAEAGEKIFVMDGSVGGGGGGGGGGMSAGTKKNLMIVAVIIAILAAMMLIPPIREMYLGAFRQFGILK
ncbi:MAG: hypothetical protein NTZ09_15500 [Candidatus Hydrogenedentes bacterium]|nr:hypothetical protein [Candidatus Hydrogenedentota bacterium]